MQINYSDSTEKVVYFVRHGQSEDNAAPVFQAPDSPLSKKGVRQANFIADRVASLTFDTLISSPYARAKKTAEAISVATNKPIVLSKLFIERVKPTSINGKPFTDSAANKTWREWEKSIITPGLRIEDGENYEDIMTRAENALDYLYQRPEKTLVVVTHGYFLRAIIAKTIMGDKLTPEAYANFQKVAFMENTGVSILTYEGGFEQEPCWRLYTYNDHAHLAE